MNDNLFEQEEDAKARLDEEVKKDFEEHND